MSTWIRCENGRLINVDRFAVIEVGCDERDVVARPRACDRPVTILRTDNYGASAQAIDRLVRLLDAGARTIDAIEDMAKSPAPALVDGVMRAIEEAGR